MKVRDGIPVDLVVHLDWVVDVRNRSGDLRGLDPEGRLSVLRKLEWLTDVLFAHDTDVTRKGGILLSRYPDGVRFGNHIQWGASGAHHAACRRPSVLPLGFVSPHCSTDVTPVEALCHSKMVRPSAPERRVCATLSWAERTAALTPASTGPGSIPKCHTSSADLTPGTFRPSAKPCDGPRTSCVEEASTVVVIPAYDETAA